MLSPREKLSYGLGDFACSMYWQTLTVYLTFYYTDVFGLSALETATLLGVSRGFDAIFDPAVGVLADRTATRWGQFRPYLLWLALPLAGAGVLTFSVPDATHALKLAWAWVTFNLLMLLYSAVNIPYTALLAVITPDPQERTGLASTKFCFAFAGGVLVAALLLPAVRALGIGDLARGWQRTFAIVGCITVGCLGAAFANTRERVPAPPRVALSLPRELAGLVRNGPWLLLASVTLAFMACVAVRSSVTLHYFKYYVGEQPLSLPAFVPFAGGTHVWPIESIMSAFNASGQLFALAGVLALPWVTRAAGRTRTFVVAFVLMLASAGSFHFLHPTQLRLMFGLNCLGAFTGGPLSALLWSMYADTLDYAEWKTGRRSTGLAFSALMFIGKQAWALGAALALVLMSRVGFEANAEQTPESREGLRWLMGLIPAGIGALSLLAMAFYPLKDARLAQIGAELEDRRAQRSPPSGSESLHALGARLEREDA